MDLSIFNLGELSGLLSQVNILSTTLRLLVALLCGGLLGIERGRKNRPAGFRTYILVCVGACIVMTTNEFVLLKYGSGDPSRLGAQVVSGIGFLGAGTIMVTGRNRVKGLTTAAGLWASACIGLAIGAGFYWGALLSTVVIFIAMEVLHNFDQRIVHKNHELHLFIEFEHASNLGVFLNHLSVEGIKVSEFELVNEGYDQAAKHSVVGIFTLTPEDPKRDKLEILQVLLSCSGILKIEEL